MQAFVMGNRIQARPFMLLQQPITTELYILEKRAKWGENEKGRREEVEERNEEKNEDKYDKKK